MAGTIVANLPVSCLSLVVDGQGGVVGVGPCGRTRGCGARRRARARCGRRRAASSRTRPRAGVRADVGVRFGDAGVVGGDVVVDRVHGDRHVECSGHRIGSGASAPTTATPDARSAASPLPHAAASSAAAAGRRASGRPASCRSSPRRRRRARTGSARPPRRGCRACRRAAAGASPRCRRRPARCRQRRRAARRRTGPRCRILVRGRRAAAGRWPGTAARRAAAPPPLAAPPPSRRGS